MLNHKLLGSVSSLPQDDNFENVTLLLSGDGTNGAQNNTFLDSSTNNFTITRNGNTTQGSFSPYGSNWSNYFNGAGDYQTLTGTALGSGDFTVEFWINPSALVSNGCIFDGGANSLMVRQNTAGILIQNRVTSAEISTTTGLSVGVWSHIAVVRNGTTVTLYQDGVSTATATFSSNFTGTSFVIDKFYDGSTGSPNQFNGFLSNLRITNTAVYTSAFTPSITPLTAITGTTLLICQSNRFIDNSSSPKTITNFGTPSVQRFSPFNPTAPYDTATIGGSAYSGGNGNDLNTSTNIAFGTNDFTIEGWFYIQTYAGQLFGTIDYNGSANSAVGAYLYCDASNLYGNFYSGSSASGTIGVSTLVKNQWNHVAYVRSGTSLALFVNGTRVGTATSSSSVNSKPISIMGSGSNNPAFVGYASDTRMVNGTAVYSPSSTTITVPTAPLTAVANTAFLGKFVNAGIPDLAMQNDLETVGNAQVSTSVKKYGTGSISTSAGSLKCLPYQNASGLSVFGGDFTWEYWFYPTGSGTDEGGGLSYRDGGFSSGCFQSKYNASTDVIQYVFDGGGTTIDFTGVTGNTWNHIALVRQNGTLSAYVNGTRSNTASYSTKITGGGSSTLGFFIGNSYDGNNYYVVGYLDDVRITNGYARYSGSSFTVPAASLPTY